MVERIVKSIEIIRDLFIIIENFWNYFPSSGIEPGPRRNIFILELFLLKYLNLISALNLIIYYQFFFKFFIFFLFFLLYS